MEFFLIVIVICVFTCQVNSEDILSCYYCDDQCSDPLEETLCCTNTTSNNDAIYMEKYSCISSFTIIDDNPVEQKGCVLKDDIDVRWSCEKLNELGDSSCIICDSNYCNSASTYTHLTVLVCALVILIKQLL